MKDPIKGIYKESLWQVYARAISLVSIFGLLIAAVIGGYDIVELTFPKFTLSSNTAERYRSNESYTRYGAVKKNLTPAQITHERTAGYEELIRAERGRAQQSLVRVSIGLLLLGILNGLLVLTHRRKAS